jgi:hypothetical protein
LEVERAEMLKQIHRNGKPGGALQGTDSARGADAEAGGVIRQGQLNADEHSLRYWLGNAFWAKKNKPSTLSEEKQSPAARFRE